MRFMNEHDVEDAPRLIAGSAQRQDVDVPNLMRACMALESYVAWVNQHSDGWPYWSRAHGPAERLMTLVGGAVDEVYRSMGLLGDASEVEVSAALEPVRKFVREQGHDPDMIVPYEKPDSPPEPTDERPSVRVSKVARELAALTGHTQQDCETVIGVMMGGRVTGGQR